MGALVQLSRLALCGLVLVAAAPGVSASLPPDAGAAAPSCDGKIATIVGTSGDDVVRGTDGDDVIVALGGDDRIVAGSGNDTICGNDGNDTLVGGLGFDVMLGGYGSDTAGYGNAEDRVRVDLSAGTASGGDGIDQLFSIENAVGSRFDDVLLGSNAPNEIRGGGGRDLIKGRDGADRLVGGLGRDELYGAAGGDVLEGVDGNDLLDGGLGDDVVRGGPGDDVLEPGGGDDVARGGAGSDTISYGASPRRVVVDLSAGTVSGRGRDVTAGIQNVVGSDHHDEIRGNGAGNTLSGGRGNDVLDGGLGPDVIDGGPDDDVCTNAKTYAGCEPVPVGFVTREGWGARPPRSGSLVPHTITRLTVHHAGTQSATTGPARYRSWQAWHMDGKGWPDISYHFIVGVDGTVYEARDPAYETDTFTDYDTTGHFQVVMEGNFDVDRPTAAQLESLAAVLAWAADEYEVSPETIAGHGDHAHTACPGDHLAAYLDSGSVQDAVEALLAAGGVDLRPE